MKNKENKFLALMCIFVLILSALTPAASATTMYVYDANGNMIEDKTTNKCYGYNDANQLKNVTDCTTKQLVAEYWYDYTGRRIKAVANGITTYYPTEDFEMNVSGTKSDNTTYFYANGERVARNDSSGMHYYHGDHLGSTNVVSGSTGAEEERVEYLPYGKVLSGGKTTKYLYTGKEMNLETGLYYYGARYYNPNMTRFIQPDTIIQDPYDPQTLNRYAYVRNNPLRYIDPTGHVHEALISMALVNYGFGLFELTAGIGTLATTPVTGPIGLFVGGMLIADGIVAVPTSAIIAVLAVGTEEGKPNAEKMKKTLVLASHPVVSGVVVSSVSLMGFSIDTGIQVLDFVNLGGALKGAKSDFEFGKSAAEWSGTNLMDQFEDFMDFNIGDTYTRYPNPIKKDTPNADTSSAFVNAKGPKATSSEQVCEAKEARDYYKPESRKGPLIGDY